jgi:hypothetical protein
LYNNNLKIQVRVLTAFVLRSGVLNLQDRRGASCASLYASLHVSLHAWEGASESEHELELEERVLQAFLSTQFQTG